MTAYEMAFAFEVEEPLFPFYLFTPGLEKTRVRYIAGEA